MKSNWYNGFLQIRRKEGKERVSDTLLKETFSFLLAERE